LISKARVNPLTDVLAFAKAIRHFNPATLLIIAIQKELTQTLKRFSRRATTAVFFYEDAVKRARPSSLISLFSKDYATRSQVFLPKPRQIQAPFLLFRLLLQP
jgi:hypothetical protein